MEDGASTHCRENPDQDKPSEYEQVPLAADESADQPSSRGVAVSTIGAESTSFWTGIPVAAIVAQHGTNCGLPKAQGQTTFKESLLNAAP